MAELPNFDEIEGLFARLLAASEQVFSESELSEVRSFVDVAEYGLALETAVAIFAEEHKTAPKEVSLLIEQLAVMMSMDSISLLRELTGNQTRIDDQ